MAVGETPFVTPSLLSALSLEMFIKGGRRESLGSWWSRLIYSACARQALSCLWDEEGITREHFRGRVREAFLGYLELVPPLAQTLSGEGQAEAVASAWGEEFLRLYGSMGYFYARGDLLFPAQEGFAEEEGFFLARGIYLERDFSMTGMAPYRISAPWGARVSPGWGGFLGLSRESGPALLSAMQQRPGWEPVHSLPAGTSYLWPWPGEEWVLIKEKQGLEDAGELTLLKWGEEQYGVYWNRRGEKVFAPVPEWMIQELGLSALIMAVKDRQGQKTKIRVTRDGSLASLQVKGAMGKKEKEVLSFLTWPLEPFALPCEDKRVVALQQLPLLQKIFEARGYGFEEG